MRNHQNQYHEKSGFFPVHQNADEFLPANVRNNSQARVEFPCSAMSSRSGQVSVLKGSECCNRNVNLKRCDPCSSNWTKPQASGRSGFHLFCLTPRFGWPYVAHKQLCLGLRSGSSSFDRCTEPYLLNRFFITDERMDGPQT